MSDTELRFIEADDEFMYFEVIHKHVLQGVIHIGKVQTQSPLTRKRGPYKLERDGLFIQDRV